MLPSLLEESYSTLANLLCSLYSLCCSLRIQSLVSLILFPRVKMWVLSYKLLRVFLGGVFDTKNRYEVHAIIFYQDIPVMYSVFICEHWRLKWLHFIQCSNHAWTVAASVRLGQTRYHKTDTTLIRSSEVPTQAISNLDLASCLQALRYPTRRMTALFLHHGSEPAGQAILMVT